MYSTLLLLGVVIYVGPSRRNYIGFAVYGSFNYPAGHHIFHDPGIDGSAYLDISTRTDFSRIIFGKLLPALMVVGIAVVIVVLLLYREEDKRKVQSNLYDLDREEKKKIGQTTTTGAKPEFISRVIPSPSLSIIGSNARSGLTNAKLENRQLSL